MVTCIQGIQVQIAVRTDKTRVAGALGHTRSSQQVGTGIQDTQVQIADRQTDRQKKGTWGLRTNIKWPASGDWYTGYTGVDRIQDR